MEFCLFQPLAACYCSKILKFITSHILHLFKRLGDRRHTTSACLVEVREGAEGEEMGIKVIPNSWMKEGDDDELRGECGLEVHG